ncbi:PAS domain S-box protein [Archaeoglobus neptunius]|uniref:PAS domain S-box protein n=1 Tax=Archaeoglobus neptunius TaxID=2798580 RepID=UPI001927BA15|nr:PAS domain S-box protein [Archaeoglobus neptunius]
MLKVADAVLELDRKGKILRIDSEFARKLGYREDELKKASIFALITEGLKPFVLKALEKGGEFPIIGKDGKLQTVNAVISEDRVSIYDVSTIPETIKTIYRGVWDFYYGLMFVDEKKRIIVANDTFYKKTGLSKSIEGKKLDEVFGEYGDGFDLLVERGSGEFRVEVNGKVFEIRAKIREINICGKRIFEILMRTLDEERLRNLEKTFEGVEHPVIAKIADRIRCLNSAAREVFVDCREVFELVSGRITGSIKISTTDGEKEYTFLKIPASEEIYVFIDVTMRNELIKKLEEELKNYRITFENSLDAILIVDVSGKVLMANSAVSLHGYKPEEVTGRNIFDFIPGEYVEFVRKNIEEGRKDGKHRRLEIQIKNKFGDRKWVEVVGSAIKNSEGEVVGAVLILRDITARRELEAKLKESEELYRTLAENSHTGIYVVQDGEVVYMNKAAKEYSGYTLEELRGDRYLRVFEEKYREDVKKTIERVLKGNTESVFTKYITKNGEKRYARLLLTPIVYKGRPAVLGNFIDMTAVVQAEKELMEREELYRTLAENSHTGIYIIQNDRIVYANNRMKEIIGYTVEELNSLEHPYKILHPDYYELAINRYRAREEGKKVPESYEVKVISKSGEEKWIKVLASRIKYKGKPAVMVNIADITDIKENEEMLKRVNNLLKIAGEISRSISQEKSEFRILAALKSLENAGLKVAVYYNEGGMIPILVPKAEFDWDGLVRLHQNAKANVRIMEDGKDILVLPLSNGDRSYGLIILMSEEGFSDEEVGILSSLARDVVFSIRSLKIEKEKEAAFKVIMDNLNQFEYLADKLRNPLAIIKGYIEVRDEFEFDEFARKVEEQADRIEEILDELRAREIATYEMKKILES